MSRLQEAINDPWFFWLPFAGFGLVALGVGIAALVIF